MKIFFDTEFTGLHQKTTLISIGLISETGKKFYAEFNDFDKNQINDWLKENVLNNLLFLDRKRFYIRKITNNYSKIEMVGNTLEVRKQLEYWLNGLATKYNSKLEFWSDCLAYDWVLFNNLWRHAFNIPDCVYYIPFDICTLFKIKNIDPDINRENFVKDRLPQNEKIKKHNALWDAYVIKLCYEKLIML